MHGTKRSFAGNTASEPSTLLACSRLQRGAGLRCEMSYVLCALSACFSSLMRSFSEEPVASGSIGQIHRAKLSARGALHTGVPPGTEVAVKVCTARCRAARRCNKIDFSDVVKHVKHHLISPEPHHQATGLSPNPMVE